jgi:hypothetical protein
LAQVGADIVTRTIAEGVRRRCRIDRRVDGQSVGDCGGRAIAPEATAWSSH